MTVTITKGAHANVYKDNSAYLAAVRFAKTTAILKKAALKNEFGISGAVTGSKVSKVKILRVEPLEHLCGKKARFKISFSFAL